MFDKLNEVTNKLSKVDSWNRGNIKRLDILMNELQLMIRNNATHTADFHNLLKELHQIKVNSMHINTLIN